jgi:hypothetical protein
MTIYDMVTKIIGPIEPAGASHLDGKRLSNLQETIELTDALVRDIISVSKCKNNYQHSMQQAGIKANDYLRTLASELNNNV